MPIILLDLIIILLLVLFNGLLAMAEMALVSARHARLRQQAEAGDRRAEAALALATEPGRFLSTVQVGITLVGVLAGAFGGATLAEQSALFIARLPALAPYSEAIGVVLVVLLITYLSLILGELVPKRLALSHAEPIALRLARPMQGLAWAVRPLVTLLNHSTEGVLRLLRVPESGDPTVTEADIYLLMEQGTKEGLFEVRQRELVERVLRLGELRAAHLLTPRREMPRLALGASLAEIADCALAHPYGHFVVLGPQPDEVRGGVAASTLLSHLARQEVPDLAALVTPVLWVPESMSALRVLDRLREQGTDLALVMDEYGGLVGCVTLEEVLAALVGNLPWAGADDEPAVHQRADGGWLVDGLLSVEDFEEQFGAVPEEAPRYYHTVGGLVMAKLGRIPHLSDTLDHGLWRIEVVDMDGQRVDKVLLTSRPLAPSDAPTPH